MKEFTSCDRLWRRRLNELRSAWPDSARGRKGALHRVRVASRRIREALPVVGASAPGAKVKKLSSKLRSLTRDLGPIRELDVELRLLEDRSKVDDVTVRAVELLRREAASKRHALRRDLTNSAPVGDLKKLIRKLERVGTRDEGRGVKGEGRYESLWRGVLAARLMRRAKELRAALDGVGPLYAPERLHELRIAVKKLRYALELARDAGLVPAGVLLRVLKREQARLGRLNDLQAVLRHVRRAQASPGMGAHATELAALADALERECRRLHADFVGRRCDLVDCAKQVRQELVPVLTGPGPRPARAVLVARPAAHARVRAS